MSKTAPKPPHRLSLLWIGLTAGATVCAWTLMAVAHFAYEGGIAHDRLPFCITVGLSTLIAAGTLTTRYIVQKNRRDAWWDGFAAGDEPLAEVVDLREVRDLDGDVRQFRRSTPS